MMTLITNTLQFHSAKKCDALINVKDQEIAELKQQNKQLTKDNEILIRKFLQATSELVSIKENETLCHKNLSQRDKDLAECKDAGSLSLLLDVETMKAKHIQNSVFTTKDFYYDNLVYINGGTDTSNRQVEGLKNLIACEQSYIERSLLDIYNNMEKILDEVEEVEPIKRNFEYLNKEILDLKYRLDIVNEDIAQAVLLVGKIEASGKTDMQLDPNSKFYDVLSYASGYCYEVLYSGLKQLKSIGKELRSIESSYYCKDGIPCMSQNIR